MENPKHKAESVTRRDPEGQAPPSEASMRTEASRPDSGPPDPKTRDLAILFMRNLVLFPGAVLPLTIGRKKSLEALQHAVRAEEPLGLLLQKDPGVDDPEPGQMYQVGVVATVLRYVTAPDGSHHAICQGQQRFRVVEFLSTTPFARAHVELVEEPEERGKEIEARFIHLREQTLEALELLPQSPEEFGAAVQTIDSPSVLADMVATYMDLPLEEKQEILEIFGTRERLDKVTEKLARRIDVLKLSRDIRQKTKGSLDKQQREYYLREQLKAIQQELGEEDSKQIEIKELREKVEKARMPADVQKEALKEIRRLEAMPEAAMEYSMVRTYLDWLVDLPWSVTTGDDIDIARARQVLDEDHFDLDKVKKRILEFLAVRKLKPDGKSPILCLAGPPGVGKTSLGQSVARATNRKFVRISLGGIHDEAEIRGHRRTYIGALPGNIIQGIRKAGSRNPVFMLDEIDKLSHSFHGDPSSALLEVLDPEQNSTFRDNYLGVPFDLSQVMFIGTANLLDAIPGPLRDRCEVIQLSGYTEEDKLEIAERYLVARQVRGNGLTPDQIKIEPSALRTIIRDYTREAGCRNLEREIGAVCRSVAARVAEGHGGKIVVGAEDARAILGAPKFESELAQRTSLPGVATGLAWTPTGGDILFVEATRMQGKGELILTGQLGDVMKESARAAVSLVKVEAERLDTTPESFADHDMHIHVPAGAIPKDGPSAGVTIYVALASLLSGRKVRSDVAMTGEISLRGLVLPVGGIKEKVVAARSAGIRSVLLPARNRKDFDDIPESARRELEFVWMERVEDALEHALEDKG